MFGFSMGEILLIGAIALIAIGPKQLPEVARTIGKMINEFRRASGDFQKAFLDVRDQTGHSIQSYRDGIEKSLNQPLNPAPVPEPQLSLTAEAAQPAQFAEASMANTHPNEFRGDEASQLSFDFDKTES